MNRSDAQRNGIDPVEVPRVFGPLDATVCVPASKSIANRALLLAALARGRSELREVPEAADVLRMIDGLRGLGVSIETDGPRHRAIVHGNGGKWPVELAEIDAGDAGSVLRFLTAAGCLGESEVRLSGSEQLRARPLRGLVDALRALGARVEQDDAEGERAVLVHGGGLKGGHVTLNSPESSQFVSALLMSAPLARSDVFIEVTGTLGSRPYVEMTLALMDRFGASAVADGSRFIVPGGQTYTACDVTIDPDASAAGYFFGLAALAGGRVQVAGLQRDCLQGDVRMADLLTEMGCRVEQHPEGLTLHGPAGELRGLHADLSDMPDAAPTLAVVAAFADGPSRLDGLSSLRFKESDRLHTIAHNLQLLGAGVEIRDDGLSIRPGRAAGAVAFESFDDHRIAMAFALVSARLDGVVIRGGACVRKSFPEFFNALREVSRRG